MKKLDKLANDMIYGDMVKRIAEERNIDLTEARIIVSEMSFKEYQLAEQTVPAPSGSTIGPTGPSAAPTSNQNDAANQAAAAGTSGGVKGVFVKGIPPQKGMIVSLRSRAGVPIPGTIKDIDLGKNGVVVTNPETKKEEWMNITTLQPYMVGGKPTPAAPGQPGNQTDAQQAAAQTGRVTEDAELSRMLQLAGVQENCSGGATGAGSIAMAAKPLGKLKKREYPEESLKPEYTAKEPAKTIIGDTKPNQASGKLSADLAASGRRAAGRINNGRKR